MGFIEVTLKLNDTEFPILGNLKKKDMDKYLLKIFKTGYQIHFPSSNKIEQQIEYNELVERIDTMKNEIKDKIDNSEINEKITSLECSLNKLIGLSSNSSKKGNFGENVLEDIFQKRYGDITFDRKSQVAHSGDAWLYLPDGQVIMLESKNYTSTVNKDEINKLQSDMITHHIKWGILTSFNSMIQGMKELDFHTFTHNNETYSIVMISNLSSDIHKLDIGLQIIRKLMSCLNNIDKFPWIVNDINFSLNELNQIIQKNYMLRDSYYTMEREIQKSLSGYYVIMRDYQYDIENKINEITNKIQSTMDTSLNYSESKNQFNELLDMYKDKKIHSLLVRFTDTALKNNWKCKLNGDTNDWSIRLNDKEIGYLKIKNKKITIEILENDLTIHLNLDKDKYNKQNLEILESL